MSASSDLPGGFPGLQLQSVAKSFPDGTAALRGVTLNADPGSRVAVVGPSGSGKSTLLAILGLLDVPSSGTYLVDGVDVGRASDTERSLIRRRLFGFVFQAFHLIPYLTATENVSVGAGKTQGNQAERNDLARRILARVGLGARLDHYPKELSGGEQQRVSIARALIRRPRYLLCDEPTGNLDSHNASSVAQLLFTVDRATTLILVTHNDSLAAACDRIVRIVDGSVATN